MKLLTQNGGNTITGGTCLPQRSAEQTSCEPDGVDVFRGVLIGLLFSAFGWAGAYVIYRAYF